MNNKYFMNILEKWIICGSFYLRKFLINHLKSFSNAKDNKFIEWRNALFTKIYETEKQNVLKLIVKNPFKHRLQLLNHHSIFPWVLSVVLFEMSEQEMMVEMDVFYDYNCYDNETNEYIEHNNLGNGIHGIIIDKYGCAKACNLNDECEIKVSLKMGSECLNNVYNS
eukprot:461228_1